MDVYSVSWLPEDHLEELCNVLKGASSNNVEECLVEYVVDIIEPAGWRAVWRPDLIRTPPGTSRHNFALSHHQEYIVEVLDVSLEKLEAEVKIVYSVRDFMKKLKTSQDVVLTHENLVDAAAVVTKEDKDDTNNQPVQLKPDKKGRRRGRKPTCIIVTETKMQAPSPHKDIPSPKAEMDYDEQLNSNGSCPESKATPDPFVSKKSEQLGDLTTLTNGAAGVKLADQSVVRARVWELTPLVQQENHVLDVKTTAEVTALVRFFYEHIFYPWDADAEFCCYDEATVTDRHSLYRRLSGETPGIPGAVAAEMHRTFRDAWLTLSAIGELEASCGALGEGYEVEPGNVQRLIKLHDKLNVLKEHFEKLRNPIMRELSMQRNADLSMTHDSSGCDSLSCALAATVNRVWLVGRCASVFTLQQLLQQLPDLVSKHYPQSVEWSVVLQPCLQLALDLCIGGDVVLLLPGTHLLNGLGALAVAGGAMQGIGEGVIIESGPGAGDIMMHIGTENNAKTQTAEAALCLRNITLKPMAHQTALLVHGSTLFLDHCSVRDCHAGVTVATEPCSADSLEGMGDEVNGRNGFCKMSACHIAGCGQAGVDVREHSAVEAADTSISNCLVGLRVHAKAKVDASGLTVRGSTMCAVEVVDAELGDEDADVRTLPHGERIQVISRQHLANVCSSHEAVTLTDNACDVATVLPDSERLNTST